MPPESLNIKASTADEARLRSFRTQAQNRHDVEMRELQAKNNEELQRLQENHTELTTQLKTAYDVQISQDAEAMADHLHDIRMQNQQRVENEKHAGDEELNKIKKSNQQQIAEYRKNSETQLTELRKEAQASMESIREKARKAKPIKGESV